MAISDGKPDHDDASAFWMRRALAEAERGRGAVEPNPMVGCVVVREGRIVGVGYHARFGEAHAEVNALKAAGEAARGADLYVTLEPCCHFGKTPPCTTAILAAGIGRVVYAMQDPFPRVAGGGGEELRRAGLVVESGVLEGEARSLNAAYLKRLATGRPLVTAKWAMTLDGKIATSSGSSQWISNARSRAMVHEIRGRMDAILVGIGTALADDPLLTARPSGPRRALRVVLDSAARLPLNSKLIATIAQGPVLVYATERAMPERVAALQGAGCEVVKLTGDGLVPVGRVLDDLGARGASNVLVEGGSRVLGAFFDAGEVDAVEVFLAPRIEGGEARFSPVVGQGVTRMEEALRLDQLEYRVLETDIWMSGRVVRNRVGLTGVAEKS